MPAVVAAMRAAFKIRDDVALAPMGPADLLLHMVASGICHSDVPYCIGDAVIGTPIDLGHVRSGIVAMLGPVLTQFKPGDHVVFAFYACGNCCNCLCGIPTQCLNTAHNNLSGLRPDGSAHFTANGCPVADMFDHASFTTLTVVRARNAVMLAMHLALRCLGPLGCGYVTGSGTV